MLSALTSLKNLIKAKSYHIDYPLFRLHYQVTASFLLSYCLILSAKVLFGDVIDCRNRRKDDGKTEFFDNICFAQGTYTTFSFIINDSNETDKCLTVPTLETPFRDIIKEKCISDHTRYLWPGIPLGPGESKETHTSLEHNIYHQYYQYITVLLFLQAFFFYLPHYLWKMWENGVISSVCKQIHDQRLKPLEFVGTTFHMIKYIRNYLFQNGNLVYKYYFCQLLLLINLFCQIVILNYMFNHQFLTYGIDTLRYIFFNEDLYGMRYYKTRADGLSDLSLNNPMDLTFPKLTSCTIELQSDAGLTTDSTTLLCVLTLNVFNDKFYLVLWCWFAILGVLTTFQIIFDLIYLMVPALQRYLFDRKYGPHLSGEKHRSSSLPELFLLDLIGSNSDRFAFIALLKRLSKEESPKTVHSLV